MTYAKTYDFVITKDWQGINELSLCHGVDKTFTQFSYTLIHIVATIACLVEAYVDTF